MADSLDALSIRLRAAADAMTGAQMREVLTTIGVQAKKDVDVELKKATGGDGRLSNWPKITFASGFEFIDDREIELKPRPDGPWQVIERGAGPHVIRAKRTRALRTPHGPYAKVRLRHGRALKVWTKAVAAIDKATPKRTADELHKLLQGKLDG